MKKIFKREYLEILIGCLLYVVGINFFLVPANIFTTGLLGIAQEATETINLILNLNMSNSGSDFLFLQTLIYWGMNLPMIIFGFKKVGKKFTLKTLVTSLIVIQILINFLTISHPLIADVNGEMTLAAELLALLGGSVLIGLGLGLIIKNQASSGGTDILAIYLSLFKKKSFGLYNLLINLVVVVWAVALSGDITKGILILIAVYIQSTVIDLTYNYNSKVTIIVMTTKLEEIGECILSHKRTYTCVSAKSGYQKNDMSMIILVLNQEEKTVISKEILEIDPKAFVDILLTDKIVGNFENKYIANL